MDNEMSKWKVLDREYIIRRPWLTARRDKVELPDGRINEEYYVLEYPDWVNVIAITQEGQFIMEQQYRHGLEVNSIELPCGVMEKGEQPLEAAQRELLEETGIRATQMMQVGAYTRVDRDPRDRVVSIAYVAYFDRRPEAIAGDDAAEAQWFPINELPPLAFDHAEILRDVKELISPA